ncbi:MAG: hypothetical protein RLY47_288, partial [Candidatus Parcubacteria bacterium]
MYVIGNVETRGLLERTVAMLARTSNEQWPSANRMTEPLESIGLDVSDLAHRPPSCFRDLLQRLFVFPIETKPLLDHLLLPRSQRLKLAENLLSKRRVLGEQIGRHVVALSGDQCSDVVAAHLELDAVRLQGDLHLLFREQHVGNQLKEGRDLLDAWPPLDPATRSGSARQLTHVDDQTNFRLLAGNSSTPTELSDGRDAMLLHELENQVVTNTQLDTNIL